MPDDKPRHRCAEIRGRGRRACAAPAPSRSSRSACKFFYSRMRFPGPMTKEEQGRAEDSTNHDSQITRTAGQARPLRSNKLALKRAVEVLKRVDVLLDAAAGELRDVRGLAVAAAAGVAQEI